MDVVRLLLLGVAVVCFAIAAFFARQPATDRGRSVDLLAVGLLAWVLVPFIDAVRALD